MASVAPARARMDRDVRFFFMSAIVMALVLVSGFSLHLAMGRSSFAAPWPIHLHALVFFGWTTLYVLQSFLAGTTHAVAIHRRLGWVAVGWVPAMVVMGCYVTVAAVQQGTVPFFFTPLYFLIMNPVGILTFAGLATAAIMMRRHTQWHRRLMFCAMATILAPGFGRILPLPFLIPFAGLAAFAPCLLFPLAGVARDLRRDRRVHPAWLWGLGAMLGSQVLIELTAASPAALAIYEAATHGSPGAAIAPRGYPPFPPGF